VTFVHGHSLAPASGAGVRPVQVLRSDLAQHSGENEAHWLFPFRGSGEGVCMQVTITSIGEQFWQGIDAANHL
jgi:hypothetical protein